MPTGTGKTFVAFLCIEKVGRPTLVVTPKIDLMIQWVRELEQSFGVSVGHGRRERAQLPADHRHHLRLAYIHLEKWSNKYGLIVFDECHHLPGLSYSEAANASLAPFRLGLTATPERADGGEQMFPQLIGPIAYRLDINDVAGEFLAPYEARRVFVDLTQEEEETYRRCREEYKNFAADRGINMSRHGRVPPVPVRGEQDARRVQGDPRVPRAEAHRAGRQREVQAARRPPGAPRERPRLDLHRRQRDRVRDRPPLPDPGDDQPDQAEGAEGDPGELPRGAFNAVVTCQVLNEGVDVPAAGVGIVLSGTGSATENVQRLGRILRKYADKQAVLYEVIARNTAEEFVSDRRRQHRAFQ
jgi:superfamily II DNA or RNA helicase